MEHQEQNNAADKVLAFDTLFTNNHIKMLKVLVFYLDSSMQKLLTVYIKFLELQHTLKYFNTPSFHLSDFNVNIKNSFSQNSPFISDLDINVLCKEILPYCNKSEKQRLENIMQMQQTIDNFQQISQTMEMIKELFPEGMTDQPDIFSILNEGNISNPDILQMFSTVLKSNDSSN